MSPGDLVEFFSSYNLFARDYCEKNPGLILTFSPAIDVRAKGSAQVLWADGSTTREHESYLHVVKKVK
jgi:hypothetical protein